MRRRAPAKALTAVIGTAAVFAVTNAQADEALQGPRPTWAWALLQLIPSPQVMVEQDVVAFGARWQLTPVLYSYGIHRSQSPWRSLVVEPIVRQCGSTELYVSPEYFGVGEAFTDRFGVRVGVRSYVPLLQRGDYLSLSFGSSWLRFQGSDEVAYEAGAHVLFGVLGTMLSAAPSPTGTRWIATLQVRVF